MKVTAIIEQNSKGRYSAYISDERIKFGVLGEGKTVEETIEDFKIGYEEMKETYLSEGMEFQELEFDFKYDMVHEFGKSLSQNNKEAKLEISDFQKFILTGPVMSDEQYTNFKQQRHQFNLWRIQ